MPGAPIPWDEFTAPAYRLNTPNASSSRSVNLYSEIIEKGSRAGKYRLRSIPGMKPFTTLPGSPMRALLNADSGNTLYAVCEDRLYKVFSDGTYQLFPGTPTNPSGSVGLNNHPAIMAENGFQIAIASAGQLYIAEGGNPGTVGPATFTTGGLVTADTVDFIDQYFIVDKPDSKEVFISNLAPDGAIWDPGDTAIKEGYPDNIARVFCDNEVLWLFGFDTTEPWSDTGNLFPFGRINGLVIKIGCSAPYSVAGIAGYRFWLWRGAIYGCQGLNPVAISDYGVEEAIATYGDVSNAEAWCFLQGKKIVYTIHFPSVQKSWRYDLDSKSWSELGLWDGNKYGIYHGRVSAVAFGRTLVGDPFTGDIWELDENTHVDAGGLALRWERTSPYLTESNQVVRHNQLTIDALTGVGLAVAAGQPGYDPQVLMRFSNNRGLNYFYERSASMGRIGQNDVRVIFNQLGSCRIGRVYQCYGADPVPVSINGAYLDLGPRVAGR